MHYREQLNALYKTAQCTIENSSIHYREQLNALYKQLSALYRTAQCTIQNSSMHYTEQLSALSSESCVCIDLHVATTIIFVIHLFKMQPITQHL